MSAPLAPLPRLSHLLLLVPALLSLLSPCLAHRGLLTRGSCDLDYGTSVTALAVPDPSISWAFKHYFDCSRRAVWVAFDNPSSGFAFYVGSGVPPVARMADLRVDAVIIGPGLPALTAAEKAALPADVRDDPVWTSGAAVGGILHQSPQDQSTCGHLGSTMQRASSVVNGRCDFYEKYGSTHSWRVLDADNNILPTKGGRYHVALWLQKHQSGKVGVALGTWQENFWKPFNIATPTCTRGMSDFSEKGGSNLACFPVVGCPADPPISRTQCAARGVGFEKVCALGVVSATPVAPASQYVAKMGCGGSTSCPSAVRLWDTANMKMHAGMAIRFTGDVAVDFVRAMIPHHVGALDMCTVLIEQLECESWDPSEGTGLDGLVHFCNHVRREQEREVAGMRAWLDARKLPENTTVCAPMQGSGGGHGGGHDGHDGHGMNHHGRRAMEMGGGCGNLTASSSVAFVATNRAMHAGMSIRFSCDHKVDFVRGMIPHHKGAVAMCETLTTATTTTNTTSQQQQQQQQQQAGTPDPYLTELCANVTRTQRAEVAWLSRWLHERKHAQAAPCGTCSGGAPLVDPPMPCEDTMPTSSFCHLLGGDYFCKCSTATTTRKCGTLSPVEGFATMNVSNECARTCGLCPSTRPPLFTTDADRCPAGTTFSEDLKKTIPVVAPDASSGLDSQKHKKMNEGRRVGTLGWATVAASAWGAWHLLASGG